MTDAKIENLALLGRVWGFIKYHHPTLSIRTIDWDAELIKAIPAVLSAESAEERNAAILAWLENLGAPHACLDCASPPRDPYFLPDLEWIDDSTLLGELLSAYLRDVYENRMTASYQRYVNLQVGVPVPRFVNESGYPEMSLPDGGFRLLALFRVWNIIEYWFPYRDVIGEPWVNVLADFIPVLYDAQSREDYELGLLQVFGRVNDTHGALFTSFLPPTGECRMPVNIRFIEGSATITDYMDAVLGPATGLEIGDVILEFDGATVEDLIEQRTPYYPAGNEAYRLWAVAILMTRGPCEPGDLRVRRGSNLIDLSVARVPSDSLDRTRDFEHDLPGDTFQMLRPEVAYIKLSSIRRADIEQYINDAQGTLGLIIDMRNYPEYVIQDFGGHLVDTPQNFARFTMAELSNPGAFVWDPDVTRLLPAAPYYDGRIAILVDETSISRSEYATMAFQTAADAVVIGSTTAGANGDTTRIPVPGGLVGLMSGMGGFYPDKRPTSRVGIIPDFYVAPTLSGITEGRDEVVEFATDWILGAN